MNVSEDDFRFLSAFTTGPTTAEHTLPISMGLHYTFAKLSLEKGNLIPSFSSVNQFSLKPTQLKATLNKNSDKRELTFY